MVNYQDICTKRLRFQDNFKFQDNFAISGISGLLGPLKYLHRWLLFHVFLCHPVLTVHTMSYYSQQNTLQTFHGQVNVRFRADKWLYWHQSIQSLHTDWQFGHMSIKYKDGTACTLTGLCSLKRQQLECVYSASRWAAAWVLSTRGPYTTQAAGLLI